MLEGKLEWHHVIIACAVILGVAVIFSLGTGKPVDVEGITVEATSILIMGG